MVEIPELLTDVSVVPQNFLREVGAFQMLRPRNIEAIDTLVYFLQTMNFLRREFFFCHHDEVNIAVKIEITYCKRALEVGTHEVVAQDRLHTVYEVSQNTIEIWIGCWKCFTHIFHSKAFQLIRRSLHLKHLSSFYQKRSSQSRWAKRFLVE